MIIVITQRGEIKIFILKKNIHLSVAIEIFIKTKMEAEKEYSRMTVLTFIP